MFIIDKTLDIAAPADLVWEVITDFARYGEWNPFIRECRCDLKPGGAIEMQVQLTSKPQFQREWIKAVTPGQGFVYNMKPVPLGALRSERSHRIESLGPDRSRYHSHFELDGWLSPLVLSLFKGGMQRGFEGMSNGIRQRAEKLWNQRQSARP